MKRERVLAVAGYTFWGMLVFACVFGVRLAEQRLALVAGQGVSLGRGVSISFYEPEAHVLPPRFAASGARVRFPAYEVQIGNIRGVFSVAEFFSGRVGFSASCEVAGGEVKVSAVSGAWFDAERFECGFDVERLDIAAMPMVPEYLGVTGVVGISGTVCGRMDGSDLEGGGRADANGIGAAVPLVALRDGRVRDGVISGAWSVDGNHVKLSGVTAQLGAVALELGGTLDVHRTCFKRSRLNIEGHWRADAGAVREDVVGERGMRLLRQGGVPIRVTGTLARPVVKG